MMNETIRQFIEENNRNDLEEEYCSILEEILDWIQNRDRIEEEELREKIEYEKELRSEIF